MVIEIVRGSHDWGKLVSFILFDLLRFYSGKRLSRFINVEYPVLVIYFCKCSFGVYTLLAQKFCAVKALTRTDKYFLVLKLRRNSPGKSVIIKDNLLLRFIFNRF